MDFSNYRGGRRLASLLAGACLIAVARLASAATMAPIPRVEPIPPDGNLPLNSALFSNSFDYGNFAVYGYVEKEFFFLGKASTRDQDTGAIIKADLPYVSRMIVRMPVNPKSFSGNVVIEPLHGLNEKSEMWEQLHKYITENGDIWVGYTVKAYGLDMEAPSYNIGGIPALKVYDPVRYARLHLEPDMRPLKQAPPAPTPPQALDLTTQVGALLKSNDPGSPLKGYKVKKLYGMGSGINGEIMGNYVRTQHDQWTLPDGGQIFDGYFYGIMGRMPPPPPKNAVHIMYRGTNEVERAATAGFIGKSPNLPNYHVYDVIGLSHLSSRDSGESESSALQLNAVLPAPDKGFPYVTYYPAKCFNVNDDPVDLFLGALYVRMLEWGKTGRPLPDAPDPVLLPGEPGAPMGDPTGVSNPMIDKKVNLIQHDPVTGTMMGGIRMPWVEAPVDSYPVLDPKMAAFMMMRTPGDVIHGGGPVPSGGAPPAGAPPGMPPGGAPPGAATVGAPPGMPSGGAPPGGPPGGFPGAGGPQAKMPLPEPVDGWSQASKEPPKLPHKPDLGGPGICFLFNPRIPLEKEQVQKLYKNYDDYVAKFEAAKTKAVKAGWLLKEDAAMLRPRGNPADFN